MNYQCIWTGSILHFNTLLENPQPDVLPQPADPSVESILSDVWLAPADREQDQKTLQNLGFLHPDTVLDLLDSLRTDSATRALSREGRQRLDRLIPYLLKEILPLEHPDLALNRIMDILKAIERRTSYLALLAGKPACPDSPGEAGSCQSDDCHAAVPASGPSG